MSLSCNEVQPRGWTHHQRMTGQKLDAHPWGEDTRGGVRFSWWSLASWTDLTNDAGRNIRLKKFFGFALGLCFNNFVEVSGVGESVLDLPLAHWRRIPGGSWTAGLKGPRRDCVRDGASAMVTAGFALCINAINPRCPGNTASMRPGLLAPGEGGIHDGRSIPVGYRKQQCGQQHGTMVQVWKLEQISVAFYTKSHQWSNENLKQLSPAS